MDGVTREHVGFLNIKDGEARRMNISVQNFSAWIFKGAYFQRADAKGGGDFSSLESKNSSAPLVA